LRRNHPPKLRNASAVPKAEQKNGGLFSNIPAITTRDNELAPEDGYKWDAADGKPEQARWN
jgi:hypothetical protein